MSRRRSQAAGLVVAVAVDLEEEAVLAVVAGLAADLEAEDAVERPPPGLRRDIMTIRT